MKRLILSALSLALLALPMSTAQAHSAFGKAVKEKHGLRTVSCYTCHSKSDEIPADKVDEYNENKKAFRNAFGTALATKLADKNVTKRLGEVKELDREDANRVKVEEAVLGEFLEALKAVEGEKSADGATYGELLKKGTLSGVKPAE